MAGAIYAKLTWDIDWEGDEVADEIKAANAVALRKGGEQLLKDTKRDVPLRTGALRESGEVKVSYPNAKVVYGAHGASRDRGRPTRYYAIPQHRREDYKHPRGGTSGYLRKNMFPGGRVFDEMGDVLRAVHES